jgi:uncharacterized protein YyaL (SSP411 family)
MAKECFYDDEIAAILNNHFISIKVDRDERPDIDRRFQLAVNAMGSSGGWPLSVFLTHDKKPFYGGTYFPPEDRAGRPGLKKVLGSVLNHYRSKRDEITKYTDRLIELLKRPPLTSSEYDETFIDESVKLVLQEFDNLNGGFGKAPKFPMPGAIEFLINRYFISKDKSIEFAVNRTLNAMGSGGFYDHLGGGFHRYSTDESWIIPHFEKMADDNSWLLRNYLDAYVVFGDEVFKTVSQGIIHFIKTELYDPDGGFYSSQDADVTPDDEGGYFTWTRSDFKKALSDEEYEVMSRYFIDERGAMHHDLSRKVLFPAMNADEIVRETGMQLSSVVKIINSGKDKLLLERKKREAPFIDKTLYSSLNGMLIASFLKGYRVLRDESLKVIALKSLDRILALFYRGGILYHSEGVKAFLDDYMNLSDGLISAYEVTAQNSYLERAVEIMDLCINNLWDSDKGGFFDTADNILEIKIKGVDDIPHPSANSLGIILLLKLNFITQNEKYIQLAEMALKAFNSKSRDSGIHAGYYFGSLDAYFNALKISIHASPESLLAVKAVSLTVPYTFIAYRKDEGYVVPCTGNVCHEPIHNPEDIKEYFKERGYN